MRGQERNPDFTLRIGPVTVEPVKGKTVRTTGYNGSVPGPPIGVPEGKEVTIEVVNGSDVAELTHWHGLHIPPAVDGAMEEGTPMVAPGKSQLYTFAAAPAGTRWYHSHIVRFRVHDSCLKKADKCVCKQYIENHTAHNPNPIFQ